MSATQPGQWADLYKTTEQLKLTTLYQEFSSDFLMAGDSIFIGKMKNSGIEVYHLCGDPSWALDNQAESMIKQIDNLLFFNTIAEYPISGIVFDVEPYILEDYTIDDLNQYVDNIKKTYKYAQSNQLYMVVVIPYWLEQKGDQLLSDIIEHGCDEVSVMNYYTSKTAEHIAEELDLASKSNKWINTIYELNFEQENTFKNFKEIQTDFNAMYHQYDYEKLGIAYHHFGNLLPN